MRRHNLTRSEFLSLNDRFAIVKFVAECPDVFDSMTEAEMADELEEYITHAA